MAKGIIYCMSSNCGLVKIGKTGLDNFNERMYDLEINGYRNISGLKRQYAVEVEDYDAMETLFHSIFDKSQVGNSELFAVDLNVVVKLMKAIRGCQIYPKNEINSNETVVDVSSNKCHPSSSANKKTLADGTYYLTAKSNGHQAHGMMTIENGRITVKKDSYISKHIVTGADAASKYIMEILSRNVDMNNHLINDVVVDSINAATQVVLRRVRVDSDKLWKSNLGLNVYGQKIR